MTNGLDLPGHLFEVSWEVCNKVGGIYTVIATKSLYLKEKLHRHHILVGPDVWMDTDDNPDFNEDTLLFRPWKAAAAAEGLRVRVGRWNVPGSPIAILVDFRQFITNQNEILTEYWKMFGVDSITGNWDYKENALFGYAAGRVIESFYKFNLSASDRVVAQFHEWQTGAGLLYVKASKLPIATVFTTHATVVGRCLAGNNLPLQDRLEGFDADAMARELNVTALHSLEKVAAQNADIVTAVSEMTARECERFLGRKVDIVTPNGFTPASPGSGKEKEDMDNARAVAGAPLWENQIKYYAKAYHMALDKVSAHAEYYLKTIESKQMSYEQIEVNSPSWKSVMVTRHLPSRLSGLEELSKNLWWCWNEDAKALFRSIDPEIWHTSGHNPMAAIDSVSIKRFKELAADKAFIAEYDKVMEEFRNYMSLKSERTEPSIGYFCMEYGLDASLKIYSGGLGILAGDYLKETSDMNVNLTAVGLLYRYGYFTQVLSAHGDQVARYDAQDFLKIPAEPVLDAGGEWMTTSVAFPGRNLTARIWKVAVGRTDLYLLDTDYEANTDEDRQVTHHLYGGDWENRLKQEILLGIGGLRALRKLGVNPAVYHYNEGHAAFTGLERLREYIENDNLDFDEALEVVRSSSLFTTHTPVPAGHDAFEEGMLRKYLGFLPSRLKIDWDTFMSLGRANHNDKGERFSMSFLAANLSQNVNGVSMLHGDVSRDIFSSMYKGYLPEELFISYVTNGVHYPTWAARDWKSVHAKVFGDEFKTHHYDKKCFGGIFNVSDEEIWDVRKKLKQILVREVKTRIADSSLAGHYSPREIVTIKETLRDDVLTIGFARRFATYKRATLLFEDLDRLDSIVNDPERPVQFIFAGKAHPADGAGQDLIKKIIGISKDERFIGKIVFIPGYDMTLAKRLVQGVDVWMNNPTRPLEASGTSGEKASMNGVMHFSVLDGWWVEGYREGAGWALPQKRSYDDQRYQNELDAATIYTTIENEIAPLYYETDPASGRSAGWISCIRNTIAYVASNFTTNRMLTDYCERFYVPQAGRTGEFVADDFAVARKLAKWKKKVRREWKNLDVISYSRPDASLNLSENNDLQCNVVLSMGDLTPEDIGVEILFAETDRKGRLHISDRTELKAVEFKDGVARYTASIMPERTGMYQVAARLYPKNPLLPHRQDFPLVKWL